MTSVQIMKPILSILFLFTALCTCLIFVHLGAHCGIKVARAMSEYNEKMHKNTEDSKKHLYDKHGITKQSSMDTCKSYTYMSRKIT